MFWKDNVALGIRCFSAMVDYCSKANFLWSWRNNNAFASEHFFVLVKLVMTFSKSRAPKMRCKRLLILSSGLEIFTNPAGKLPMQFLLEKSDGNQDLLECSVLTQRGWKRLWNAKCIFLLNCCPRNLLSYSSKIQASCLDYSSSMVEKKQWY